VLGFGLDSTMGKKAITFGPSSLGASKRAKMHLTPPPMCL